LSSLSKSGRVTYPIQSRLPSDGTDTYINLMAHYHPAFRVSESDYPEIDRCITGRSEFHEALDAFSSAGLARVRLISVVNNHTN
jgi:uncharacterized Fe-S radical SAM superfamily protein PflX